LLLSQCAEKADVTQTQASECVCCKQNKNYDKDCWCVPQQHTVLDNPRGMHNMEICEHVGRACGYTRENSNAYRVSVWKCDQLGYCLADRRRWVDSNGVVVK